LPAAGRNDKTVKQAIDLLLDAQEQISNRDVVAAIEHRISRQAVHLHLAELVKAGVLEPVGAGRSVRYQRVYAIVRRFPTADLDEAAVWTELSRDVDALAQLAPEARSLIMYIFTEMVNNAIDHSDSARWKSASRLSKVAFTSR
jgi:predicted ArsR family transcriptional regulator